MSNDCSLDVILPYAFTVAAMTPHRRKRGQLLPKAISGWALAQERLGEVRGRAPARPGGSESRFVCGGLERVFWAFCSKRRLLDGDLQRA